MKTQTLLSLAAVFGMGCTVNGPYEVGLMVKSTSQATETTKTYREILGNAPFESNGLLGFGETCTDASSSIGTTMVESLVERKINIQVVGETLVPRLIPNDTHEQEEVWLSLVMENTREGTTNYAINNNYNPYEDPTTWTTEELTDDPKLTETSYYGVTAEDYVAKFDLPTMWPADDAGLNPTDAEMLTKHNPKKGDVWFSNDPNLNSVYIFDGFEDFSIDDAELKAARVLVYEYGDVELASSGILTQCINAGRDQYGNTIPGATYYDDQVTLLDVGCEDGFRHVQTGTQWWYNGILVKEEVTNVDVTIHDYGWEWYETSSDGNSCSRETSTIRPDVQADLYIEFSVTTSQEIREAEEWYTVEEEE